MSCYQLGADGGALGAADHSYFSGSPGDKPYVVDFDGDGIDEVGLHRESTGHVYHRFTHTQGVADAEFIFGDPGDKMVAAAWAGRGAPGPESVGLFRAFDSTIHLRYGNSQDRGLRSADRHPCCRRLRSPSGSGYATAGIPTLPSGPLHRRPSRLAPASLPGSVLHAHVFDTRTGCEFAMHPEARQRTASVFKVMVMAGTLHEAQSRGEASASGR